MGDTDDHDGSTFFASTARASQAALERDVAFAAANPVVDALLALASGLLAVLNEERQVVAVNSSFLTLLGVHNAQELLGLRPGEALKCTHANDPPNGCGTTEFCMSCGAAIAIVSSLATETPQERKCVLTTEIAGTPREMCFQVRACPMRSGRRRYVVLFLHDVTTAEHLATLNRALLHDVSNHLVALLGASELLAADGIGDRELLQTVSAAARQVRGAVAVHRALMNDSRRMRPTALTDVQIAPFIDELVNTFRVHPAASRKSLVASGHETIRSLRSDAALLMRVLGNMVVNALEATPPGGCVRIGLAEFPAHLEFSVHNPGFIPRPIAVRIFQRYFSTHNESGRGLGTYAMKLIGEQVLGGKVDFTSTESDGTTFRFLHPW